MRVDTRWVNGILRRVGVGGCALLLCACGDDDGALDAGVDASPPPDVSPLAPDPNFDDDYPPLGSEVTVTTLVQTTRPRYPADAPVVDRYGRPRIPVAELGHRHPQPGEPHVVRDDLGVGDATPVRRRSLAYFVHLSDVQLTDTQSPSYTPVNKLANLGYRVPTYHAADPFAVHLLDAALRTAGRFAVARPFDFVVHTGDAVEHAQRNELQWFLGVLSGGRVEPDSGGADDPVPGPDNDAYDPFLAAGLPAGTPWFAVLGNHDLNVTGFFPVGLVRAVANEPGAADMNDVLSAFGLVIPPPGEGTDTPNAFEPSTLPAFVVDPDAFEPDTLWDDDDLAALQPGTVEADARRAQLSNCELVEAHFGQGGTPDGHGFTADNQASCQGYYAVDPIPGVPLRLLVLDTGPQAGGASGLITRPLLPDGSVDETRRGDPRYDQIAWLEQELERSHDDGVAVIVASHHPSQAIAKGSPFADLFGLMFPDEAALDALWRTYYLAPEETLDGEALRTLLTGYDHVVAHLVGHSHSVRVTAICPDGEAVEGADFEGGARCAAPPPGRKAANGYWEIMSPSTREFPNQLRILEVVDHGDGTGMLYATLVTAQSGAEDLVHRALFLSMLDQQFDRIPVVERMGVRADRNVSLRFHWGDGPRAALTMVSAAAAIESETTLATPAPGLPALPEWP